MYKKIIKQTLSFILCLCISLSVTAFPFSTAALSVGSENKFNETQTGYSYKWAETVAADGNYHSSHGQITMRTLKSDNKPIYCLQPNVPAYNVTNTPTACRRCAVKK